MPNPETIAFFNSNASWGGGEKWHFDIATRLMQRGHRVIFFVQKDGELHRHVRDKGILHEAVRVNNYSFVNPFRIVQLTRLFRKHRIASVILNLPSDAKVAGLAARRAGIPKIIYRRGTALPVHNNFVNRMLFRRVITHIVTNSEATKKLLLERNPGMVDEKKIHVIYNGLDLEQYDQLPAQPVYQAQEGELLLGNAGRFVEQKGHQYLLETAQKLKNQHIPFKLLLAGDGKLESSIRQQVTKEGLEEHILFTGFQSNIRSFMESVDLFLLTSLWEGFGYVIAEAMAAQKPVLAFNLSSNPEIIDDGTNGYLVPFGDTDQLTQRIIYLYKNPNLRQQLGQQARLTVERRFDITRTVEEIEQLLKA